MFRDNRAEYNAKAEAAVLASKQDIPEGFVMPTTLNEAPPAKVVDDDDFWAEDGSDDDFGASDSSGEEMDEDGEEQEESEEEEQEEEEMETEEE
jgi:ubiquitin-conjugating enzyme E2 R